MKNKLFLILCMLLCVFGITACGNKKSETNANELEQSYLEQYAQSIIEFESQLSPEELEQFAIMDGDELAAMVGLGQDSFITGDTLLAAVQSWNLAQADMGTFKQVNGFTLGGTSHEGTTLIASVLGEKRNADMAFMFDKNMRITSVTTDVVYTFAEKMEKAALNTLLGMGTVFTVLILISFIISQFKHISKIEMAFSNKNQKEIPNQAGVNNVIAQITEKEEMLDDFELVAVITAAIATAQGSGTSTDGFVVRSIRKSNKNKWQNA